MKLSRIAAKRDIPHGPGIGLVPAGTRFEIFHRMRKMARRANPIPKDTPKYWRRLPIVNSITKVLELLGTTMGNKTSDDGWVITA